MVSRGLEAFGGRSGAVDVTGPLPRPDGEPLGEEGLVETSVDLGAGRDPFRRHGEFGGPPRVEGPKGDLEERTVFDVQGVEVELGRGDPHRPPDDPRAPRRDRQLSGLIEDHPLHRRVGFIGGLGQESLGHEQRG